MAGNLEAVRIILDRTEGRPREFDEVDELDPKIVLLPLRLPVIGTKDQSGGVAQPAEPTGAAPGSTVAPKDQGPPMNG